MAHSRPRDCFGAALLGKTWVWGPAPHGPAPGRATEAFGGGELRKKESFGLSYPKMYIDGIGSPNPFAQSRASIGDPRLVEVKLRGGRRARRPCMVTDAISGVPSHHHAT